MHTHKLLKVLKLRATSTELSHTYTLLKHMEETTFQSASKQKKPMFLFSTFVRNSVKIWKYNTLSMLVFFHGKHLLNTYLPEYFWQPQNLTSENTNTDENCCDLTQWTTDFLRRYFTQIHGKGTQRNAYEGRKEKKHILSQIAFSLCQVQNKHLLKGVWVLICSQEWHKNTQRTELYLSTDNMNYLLCMSNYSCTIQ